MTLFAGGSMLGGLATAPGLLIGARIIQGLGAAALFPSTLALVNTTFAEGPQRDRALGLWAAAAAGGLSLGALLGGVLTEAVGWRGVFFVTVPGSGYTAPSRSSASRRQRSVRAISLNV